MIDVWIWMNLGYKKLLSLIAVRRRHVPGERVWQPRCQDFMSSRDVMYVSADGGCGSTRFKTASLPVSLEKPVRGGDDVALVRSQYENYCTTRFKYYSSSRQQRHFPLPLLFLLHTPSGDGLRAISGFPLPCENRLRMGSWLVPDKQEHMPSWTEWLVMREKKIKNNNKYDSIDKLAGSLASQQKFYLRHHSHPISTSNSDSVSLDLLRVWHGHRRKLKGKLPLIRDLQT